MRTLGAAVAAGLIAGAARAQDARPELPDFSAAGYRGGQDPPDRKATVDVRDFGAKGDGTTDDTDAFRRAVAKACESGGVVGIPEGRWVLTGELVLDADGVVLRGAGSGKSVLVCPKALADLHGEAPKWSWSGAFVRLAPRGGSRTVVGTVAKSVKAGERALELALEAGVAAPRAGEWLELLWHNDQGKDTLLDHLYGGVIPRERMGKELQDADGPRVREWVRIESVDGATATVERPLRIDARPEWRPTLVRAPVLRECGVEGVTFEFPETKYPGHLKERGYNAVEIGSAVDCWVRDVETVHADSGVFVGACRRVTVRGFRARGRNMHHVLCVSWGSDCLFTEWTFEAPHVHGTTISWAAHGNVFSHGRGRNLAMDAHRAAPFENLHAHLVIECSSVRVDPFRSGGSAPRGPHAARGNVYWDVELRYPDGSEMARIGPVREWPKAVFAGWRANVPLEFREVEGLGQRILDLGREPTPRDPVRR